MAKPWKEVEASPQFQQLSPAQKIQAQQQYFNEVVAPAAGANVEAARQQFFSRYNYQQPQQQPQQEIDPMKQLAQEQSALDAFLIGTGRGFATVARATGLMKPEDETTARAMEALREERPISTFVGEATGSTLPFVPLGGVAGTFAKTAMPTVAASRGAQIAGMSALGGLEGATIAKGEGGSGWDIALAGGLGGALGAGGEVLAPIISRYAGQIVDRVKGRPPQGALFDEFGNPTPELQQALDSQGIKFEDLVDTAQQELQMAQPRTSAEQLARKAVFQQEGIPTSRADVTGATIDRATENRLVESTTDRESEPFRSFKLAQSNAIRESLERGLDLTRMPENTGQDIIDALSGYESVLQSRKTELYGEYAKAAKQEGLDDLPLFTDNIRAALPDENTLDDLDIAGASVGKINDLLMKYGVIEPSEDFLSKGRQIRPLTMESYDSLRKALNQFMSPDMPSANRVIVPNLIKAIDQEAADMALELERQGVADSVLSPLKEARQVVREMKTTFDPKAIAGQLTDFKRGGNVRVKEASQVYDTLMRPSTPVENVRSLMATLRKAPNGDAAQSALQQSIMLDLIDAAYSTPSNTINNVPVFNQNAFNRRLQAIGDDKLKAIFGNNPEGLARIRNFERIAKMMQTDAIAKIKGSQGVITELANNIGLTMLSSKVPILPIILEGARRLDVGAQTRKEVVGALNDIPDILPEQRALIERYPNLSRAISYSAAPIGVSAVIQNQNQ